MISFETRSFGDKFYVVIFMIHTMVIISTKEAFLQYSEANTTECSGFDTNKCTHIFCETPFIYKLDDKLMIHTRGDFTSRFSSNSEAYREEMFPRYR